MRETLNDEFYLMDEMPLTAKSVTADGVFLLDNGQTFFVITGDAVPQPVMDTFFDSSSGCSLKGREENVFVEKLWLIMDYLQSVNYRHRSTEIITSRNRKKQKEFAVLYMIRDRTDSVMSYEEFHSFLAKQTNRANTS